jgi:hypothetical protein
MQYECMGKKPLPVGFSFLSITPLVSYNQPDGRMLNVSLRLGIALRVDVGTNTGEAFSELVGTYRG